MHPTFHKKLNRLADAVLIMFLVITACTIWDSYTLQTAVQIEEGAQ